MLRSRLLPGQRLCCLALSAALIVCAVPPPAPGQTHCSFCPGIPRPAQLAEGQHSAVRPQATDDDPEVKTRLAADIISLTHAASLSHSAAAPAASGPAWRSADAEGPSSDAAAKEVGGADNTQPAEELRAPKGQAVDAGEVGVVGGKVNVGVNKNRNPVGQTDQHLAIQQAGAVGPEQLAGKRPGDLDHAPRALDGVGLAEDTHNNLLVVPEGQAPLQPQGAILVDRHGGRTLHQESSRHSSVARPQEPVNDSVWERVIRMAKVGVDAAVMGLTGLVVLNSFATIWYGRGLARTPFAYLVLVAIGPGALLVLPPAVACFLVAQEKEAVRAAAGQKPMGLESVGWNILGIIGLGFMVVGALAGQLVLSACLGIIVLGRFTGLPISIWIVTGVFVSAISGWRLVVVSRTSGLREMLRNSVLQPLRSFRWWFFSSEQTRWRYLNMAVQVLTVPRDRADGTLAMEAAAQLIADMSASLSLEERYPLVQILRPALITEARASASKRRPKLLYALADALTHIAGLDGKGSDEPPAILGLVRAARYSRQHRVTLESALQRLLDEATDANERANVEAASALLKSPAPSPASPNPAPPAVTGGSGGLPLGEAAPGVDSTGPAVQATRRVDEGA